MKNCDSIHYKNDMITVMHERILGANGDYQLIKMPAPPWCCYDNFIVSSSGYRQTCMKIDRILDGMIIKTSADVALHRTTCNGCSMCKGYNPALITSWICNLSGYKKPE